MKQNRYNMKKTLILITYIFLIATSLSSQDLNSFSPGPYELTPLLEGGLWGYKNESGEIAIKPKFELAVPFYRNSQLTPAKYKNSWVLINQKGKIKEKLDIDEISTKSHAYAWIYRKNDKYGIILHDGKILTKAIYDYVIQVDNNKEPINSRAYLYKLNGKIGVNKIFINFNKKTDRRKEGLVEYIPAGNYEFYNFGDLSPINVTYYENSCKMWGDKNYVHLDNFLVKLKFFF
jgi:hypothetical protein